MFRRLLTHASTLIFLAFVCVGASAGYGENFFPTHPYVSSNQIDRFEAELKCGLEKKQMAGLAAEHGLEFPECDQEGCKAYIDIDFGHFSFDFIDFNFGVNGKLTSYQRGRDVGYSPEPFLRDRIDLCS